MIVGKIQIFISYSLANIDIAETLESQLKAAGFDVWRDRARVETDWSREIAEALARSHLICLVWTKESSEAKWVKHEWLTASALEKPVIPCIFPGSPSLPQRLSNTQWIVFGDFDESIQKLRDRIANMTSFRQEYDYTKRPSNAFIPYNPNPSFTGRHDDLLNLYLKMIGNLNKTGLNQVGLVGMGGIGKTQLAVEFVYRFSFSFEGGIYWIDATDHEQWLRRFIVIAKAQLRLETQGSAPLQTSEEWLHALQKYFIENPPTLIVMDNVPDPDHLHDEQVFQGVKGLTPLTLGCDLLFTTLRHFDLPGTLQQNVGVLSKEAAYTIITRRRKPDAPDQEKYARDICDAVGRLPLALVLIEGYLSNYTSVSFADYYAELSRQGLDVIDQNNVAVASLATRHQTSVAVTLRIQWRMLKDKNAKQLFKLASLFPQASFIPNARLGLLSGIPLTISGISRPLDEAFNTLYSLSLIEKSLKKDSVTLHPLVRDFAQRQIEANVRWIPGIGVYLARSVLQCFKNKAVTNLKKAYTDQMRLYSEYRERGIDQVIGDIDTAIEWGQSNESLLEKLKTQKRLLDRERHHLKLRSQQGELGPVSFLQQLHYRAFAMGFDELAEIYFAAKRSKGNIILGGVAISEYEDPSWIRTLRGQLDDVGAVSLSSNGERALSADFEGGLLLWDVATGDAIRSFRIPFDGDTPKVGLDADGKIALISTQDDKLILLDVNSGERLKILDPNLGYITSVGLSSDGQQGMSAHENGILALWDMKTGKQLAIYQGLPNVQAVTQCLDGWYAISQAPSNTHTLWKVDTGEVISKFKEKSDWSLLGASLSRNKERAISGSAFSNLTVWNPKTGEETRILKGHESGVRTVSLSADGKLALSASRETLVLWDLELGQPHPGSRGHMRRVDALSLTSDGKWALSGSDDKTLILWDARTGNAIRKFKDFPAMLVSIDSNCKRVLSGSIFGDLVFWNLESEEIIHRLNVQPSQLIGINLSSDAKTALAYTNDNRLILWDTESGKQLISMRQNRWGWPAGFTSDNHYAAVTRHNKSLTLLNRLEIWDIETERKVRTFKFPSQSISGVCFLDNSQHVLVALNSNRLILSDVETGKTLSAFNGFGQLISSRELSASGKYLLTASNPDNMVLNRWGADGKFIDRHLVFPSIILWDVERGEALVQLLLPNPPTSFAIAGSQIVFGDQAGVVCFLRIIE